MKTRKLLSLTAAVAAAVLAVGIQSATAQSVAAHFVGNPDPNGDSTFVNNGDTNALAATDMAGVAPYTQVNWNNLTPDSGTVYGGNMYNSLVDSAGNTTGLGIIWKNAGVSFTGDAGSNTNADGTATPDGKIMDVCLVSWGGDGYTDPGNNMYYPSQTNCPIVYINGLQSWMTGQGAVSYTIVEYFDVPNGELWWGPQEHWVQATSGDPTTYNMTAGADLTAHIFAGNSSHFNGTYVQATSISSDSPTAGGNYCVFEGLTNDAVLLRVAQHGYQQNSLCGLQIIPKIPELPIFSQQPPSSISTYAGQSVTMTANGGGSPTPSFQWQAGSGGEFTNLVDGGSISGSTFHTLSISPTVTANSGNYQLVLSNPSGSVTSSICALNVTPVPTNGVWTAFFQYTNSGQPSWGWPGSGSYTGRGVLSSGTNWNPVPGIGGWTTITAPETSISDYQDDGVTHCGITCTVAGGQSGSSPGGVFAANDPRALLSQWAVVYGYSANEIVFSNVPSGYYNLAFHAIDGASASGWNDRGATFVVHGANGDQTAGTTNSQFAHFADTDTTVIFTNVEVTSGVLNVDMTPTPSVPAHSSNDQAYFNAAEIQFVSSASASLAAGFSGSPTNIFVTQSVTFANTSTGATNWLWDFGDGNTLNTNDSGSVTHAYTAAGTYSVSQTVTGSGNTDSMTKTAYITVLPKPVISSTKMSAGSLVLSGVGGISGQQYRILTSTNVALPLASWTTAETGTFATDGSYGYTNSSPTNAASYFILVSP